MRLLDQVRDVIRKKHYSLRTEQAYVGWIPDCTGTAWTQRCHDDHDLHPCDE